MLRNCLRGYRLREVARSVISKKEERNTRFLLPVIERFMSTVNYVQGNSPRRGVREYFYYIDHQGQLFLDDTKVKNFITCFKDKEFLLFFFKRLKLNNTGLYSNDFPYVSPCGREINFVRCDDRPIVFTQLMDDIESKKSCGSPDLKNHLVCNFVGAKFTYPFNPCKICMLPRSGRVYHPAPEKAGGVGLVKSSLAIELSSHFIYPPESSEFDPPTHFEWENEIYELDNEIWQVLKDKDLLERT